MGWAVGWAVGREAGWAEDWVVVWAVGVVVDCEGGSWMWDRWLGCMHATHPWAGACIHMCKHLPKVMGGAR